MFIQMIFVTGSIYGLHNYSVEHSIRISPSGAGPGVLTAKRLGQESISGEIDEVGDKGQVVLQRQM